MTILVELRSAIIEAIAEALPEQLREVKAHGGRFSLEELAAISARSPSVRVACLGADRIEWDARCVTARTTWAAFIITGDRTAAGQAPVARDAAALALTAAIAALVPLFCFGLDNTVDSAREVRADNLFSRALDQRGVALWAVTWRHTVDLNPVDISTLDDFLRAHAGWDIDADGTADAHDIVEYDPQGNDEASTEQFGFPYSFPMFFKE